VLRGSSPTTPRGLQPAERSLYWFTEGGKERLGTSLRSSQTGLASLVSGGTSLRVLARWCGDGTRRWTCARRAKGRRCAVRSRSPQMRSQIQDPADAQSGLSARTRETQGGPSQTCCGYVPTLLSVTTHLRRLRLGDLSRWVRRGCLCRAKAKAQASSPCPTRSGTSRYKEKSWIGPSQPYQCASAERRVRQTPPRTMAERGWRDPAMRTPSTLPWPEPNRSCDLACDRR